MQQTKRLMIVSLLDELQQGEAVESGRVLSAGTARKKPAAPVHTPTQNMPQVHVSTPKAPDAVAEVRTGGKSELSVQTPAALSEQGVEPAGIRGGTDSGFQGNTAEGRTGTPAAGSPTMSSGISGPGSSGSGTTSAGNDQQAEESDPALRRKIRDSLQKNLVYPYLARKKRIEGTVLAEFRLNSSGMPENMRIVRTSNYAILDEAAKETIQKAAPFPAQNKRVEIPITFRLRE